MKILYVTEVPVGSIESGQNAHVTDSLEAFTNLGHEVSVIARGQVNMAPVTGERISITPVRLPLVGTFLTQRKYQKAVRYLIAVDRPDFLYVRLDAASYGALRACIGEIPFFVEVNGDLVRELELQGAPRRLRWLCSRVERLAYRYARGIVVVGEGEKEAIVRRYGIDPERFFISPNGADEKVFKPNVPFPDSLRNHAGDETFRWVFVGSVTVRYALEDVLRVQKHLEEEGVKIALWIVGEGDLLLRLKELAGSLGLKRVRFLGWVSRDLIPGILSSSDLGIFAGKPITPIGSPIKVAEYLGCGLPVVFREGNPEGEELERAGAAILVPFEDPSRAASRIRAALENKEEMKAKAERARNHFLKEMTRKEVTRRLSDYLEHQLTGDM